LPLTNVESNYFDKLDAKKSAEEEETRAVYLAKFLF
jgi:hypothetical protein